MRLSDSSMGGDADQENRRLSSALIAAERAAEVLEVLLDYVLTADFANCATGQPG